MDGVNGNQLPKKPVRVNILQYRNECESMEKLDKRMIYMRRDFGYPRGDVCLYKNYPHDRVPKKILNSRRRDSARPGGLLSSTAIGRYDRLSRSHARAVSGLVDSPLPDMARLERAICRNAMERATARSSRAMTGTCQPDRKPLYDRSPRPTATTDRHDQPSRSITATNRYDQPLRSAGMINRSPGVPGTRRHHARSR
jgi:hypothetical protein